MTNNYTYVAEGEDSDNAGVIIPRYRASGRMAPSGKRYPTYNGTPDESDFVPVRSIITKVDNPKICTPDLIGTQYTDLTDRSAIGSSFGTSFTEAITQAALSLKHGGHEKVLDRTAYLYAPKACTAEEKGPWLILHPDSGKDLKYPKPENVIFTDQTRWKKDELVCTAYHTQSPINKLNSLVKLLGANNTQGFRYFEKENIIVSDCYAYEAGEITYEEDKKGNMRVRIGSREYDYNPKCMYFFPEGTKIKKYQRFCSGLANMSHVASDLTSLQDIYVIFRKQFYEVQESTSLDKKTLPEGTTQEELVEFLFASLMGVKYNKDTHKIDSITYLGTRGGIQGTNSFYTSLSFGYASAVVGKALKGEIQISDDRMTETVLGLLLNNKLD